MLSPTNINTESHYYTHLVAMKCTTGESVPRVTDNVFPVIFARCSQRVPYFFSLPDTQYLLTLSINRHSGITLRYPCRS